MNVKHLLSEGSQTQGRAWGGVPFLHSSTEATRTSGGRNEISGCFLFCVCGGARVGKGHEGNFWGDRNVPCLDQDMGHGCIYLSNLIKRLRSEYFTAWKLYPKKQFFEWTF